MTVYVDELQSSAPYKATNWPYPHFCHMFSDDLEELHQLAQSIGLKREWFQGHLRDWMKHYDLTPNKRRMALRKGAVEIGGQEWARQHINNEGTLSGD